MDIVEFLFDICVPIMGIFLIIFAVFFGAHIANLIMEPQVIVFVDRKEIYRGSNACITEKSLGAATSIQINKGPFCFFPGPKYTSKNVEVKPQ